MRQRRFVDVLSNEALQVAVVVVVTFVVYAVLAHLVQDPRIVVDEIRYMDAAASLADGNGLHTRGEAYGWAPGYPATLAPILALAPGRPEAYAWIKLANAFFLALSAVPVYLLGRALVPRLPALAVTVLAVAIPSSVYVGLVMTESLAYLVFCVAMLAFVRAVERPTVPRQLGALAALAAAYLVRSQFAVLYPAYVVALGAALAWEVPGRCRPTLRSLWPSAASLVVIGVGVLGLLVSRGASALGRYDDLWRSYNILAVARWFVYHAADLSLYLGLFPVVFVPAILAALYRNTDLVPLVRRRAFFLVLTTVTAGMLLVTAAFASTPFSEGRLHDRYIFYVVPLWLIAGAHWLCAGGQRSRGVLVAGSALLLAPLALLPFDRLVAEDPWRQLEAAGTQIWSRFGSWTVGHGVSGHRAIVVLALAAAAAAVLLPRRLSWILAVPVAVTFVANGTLLWQHGVDTSRWHVFADRSDRTLAWVDAAVPPGSTVTILDVSSSRCPQFGIPYALTEFYNDRVGPVAQLSRPADNGLPTLWIHLAHDGKLVGRSGRPLAADWVVLPPGVKPQGSTVAQGTRRRLVLWRVPGVVVVKDRSETLLAARACSSVQVAGSE